MIDRDFLAYKIKEVSTGSEVRMEITCEACGKKSLLEVDLSVLKTKPFDQELPIETTELGITTDVNFTSVNASLIMKVTESGIVSA